MMRVFVARTTNPRSSSSLLSWFPSPLVRNAKGFAFVVLFAFAAFIEATNTLEFPLIKGAEAFAFPLRSPRRDGGDDDDYDGGAALDQTIARFARDVEHSVLLGSLRDDRDEFLEISTRRSGNQAERRGMADRLAPGRMA